MPEVGTEVVPFIVCQISLWLCQYVMCIDTATKSGEQIELQAKLLNYFLGSNKSNINQSVSKLVPEARWAHLRDRSMGVLSERWYPSGVKV